jgi:RecA-family ATPase
MTDALTERAAQEWRAERDRRQPESSPRLAVISTPTAPTAEYSERNPPPPGEGEVEAIAELPWFSAAELADKPVPPRGWYVRDVIPDRTVTLLGGDGGTGKSLLALQLAVAGDLGAEWIGQLPEQGAVVFASAEDDKDELHRRLSDIVISHGGNLAELKRVYIVSLAGLDAVMGTPDKGGIIRETAVWRALVAKVERVKPRLVVIDTLADVFAGDENKRAQARQFIGLLRKLAIEHECAVLLLNHPSLSGMASGSGTSGSTGWNNSVRSRLYFDRIRDEEDNVELDADLRRLSVLKANYSQVGPLVTLRWKKGVFRVEGEGKGDFDRTAESAKSERVFLDLIAEFEKQGRHVSSKPSGSYAPTAFARNPAAVGLSKKALKAAMERLFAANRIKTVTCGPQSRQWSKIVLVNSEEEEVDHG